MGKISSDADVGALAGTELIPVVKGGANGTTTPAKMKSYGGIPAGGLPGQVLTNTAPGVGAWGNSASVWSSSVTYASGDLVFDRGGIWQATGGNTNSQPVSGNTHWTLIGGEPYVDFVLDPVTMTTAPYLDIAAAGPGMVLVPGTSDPNNVVVPVRVFAVTGEGSLWGNDTSLNFSWGSSGGVNVKSLFPRIDSVSNYLPDPPTTGHPPWRTESETVGFGSGVIQEGFSLKPFDTGAASTVLETIKGLPLVAWSDVDCSDSGFGPILFGTRSFTCRLYYTEAPVLAPAQNDYFRISFLDQGAKTFIIGDDASALTGTVTVVGSTGNDGDYTIVSATTAAGAPRNITVADQPTYTVTIAGDHRAEFPSGVLVTIAGSTGNDGVYSTGGVALDGGNTTIAVAYINDGTADGTITAGTRTEVVVLEAIPDAAADGWVKQ